MLVYDLGRGLAVGINEVADCVGVVVAFSVAVAQGELQSAFRGNLASELADAFPDGALDDGVDGVDRFDIGLGDDDRAAELGSLPLMDLGSQTLA